MRFVNCASAGAASLILYTMGAFVAHAEVLSPVSSTPAGNHVKAPSGWSTVSTGRMLRFSAPQGDLSLSIVDVGKSHDARSALRAAWAIAEPQDHHSLGPVTPLLARRGWDERVDFEFQTAPAEHLTLFARAYRHAGSWTVVIEKGSNATVDKTLDGSNTVWTSLSPPGYVEETFSGHTAHRLDAKRVEELRDFVKESISQLGIPGASFALVDHGRVVYEGGVGVKRLGSPAKVGPHTEFMIGSNTKGMTTLLLARMVDAHQLTWDETVTNVYPDFRLGDQATTSAVRIRDLLCACTGLPRDDLGWIFDTPPDEPADVTFKILASMQPTTAFGKVFQYNNQMAAAAGYVAAYRLHPDREVGAAYDQAMQEAIFKPLGMDHTTFSFSKAMASDYASPHGRDINGSVEVSNLELDKIIVPYRPAAGAWSNADDFIKYAELELTQGLLPDGERLVSSKNLLERRINGVAIGGDRWYGMGLERDLVSGLMIIHHGGTMPGYHSDFFVIPDADVAAVIMTNSDDGESLLGPFERRLLEVLYDGKPQAKADVAFAAREIAAENIDERKKVEIPPPATVDRLLAPHYHSRELGYLDIIREGGRVKLVTASATTYVASRSNPDGSTSLVTASPGIDGFQFLLGKQNGLRTLTISDDQHRYVFTEASNHQPGE